ncbi:MAG: DUF2846 domain-containing protein [Gammaproteobacteria bacterium]|nr:DUF2846 domain-containing protein [Gammaproteobacteria bacterium]
MEGSIKAVLFIVLCLITGCATVPLAPVESDIKAKAFEVQASKSNIYLYRNEIIGSAITMPIGLDGSISGKTSSKTYFMWVVEPGEHEISSYTENTAKIVIDAKPGKNHFVWQEVKMGVWAPRSKLHEVSEDVGRKGVLECKLIQPEPK